MTRVWLDWLVKVAVVTAVFGLMALAAGWDQAVAGQFAAPVSTSHHAAGVAAANPAAVASWRLDPVAEARCAARPGLIERTKR